jgi:hypothetical protein
VPSIPTFWWHVRTGDWITAHHAVPWRDVFGRYTLGHHWLAYAWFFELIVSTVYRVSGLSGIMALTSVLMLCASTGSLCCWWWCFQARPHSGDNAASVLFSIVLLTIELNLLLRSSVENSEGWFSG